MNALDLIEEYLKELKYKPYRFPTNQASLKRNSKPGTFKRLEKKSGLLLNGSVKIKTPSHLLVRTFNRHFVEITVDGDEAKIIQDKGISSVKLNHPDSLTKIRSILNF